MSQFDDVRTAIEMLLEQIDAAVDCTDDEGSRAFRRGDYEEVDTLRKRAAAMRRFRQQVEGLTAEWREIMEQPAEALESMVPGDGVEKAARGPITSSDPCILTVQASRGLMRQDK